MLLVFFYEVFLLLGTLFWLPRVLLHWSKYRRNFGKRFGFNLALPERREGLLIWVHAVSVGETKAVIPLVKLLHERHPEAQFVFSSITATGFDEAKRSVGIPCFHLFLPLDFGFILRPILKKLRPNLVVVSETDFWFRFLTLAKQYGASIALVNGKVSERSARRLKFFPFLIRPIDVFLVQTEEYAKRFASIGASHITVTGNLKYDQKIPRLSDEEKMQLRLKLRLSSSERVVVIGSTHEGEERLLLQALAPLSDIKIVLVPRHPERFDSVAALLRDLNISYSRYSKPSDAQVLLVDAMGVLNQLYQIADVAIVAGSFRPGIGGHNILEPVLFHVPVLFGPHMENQEEMKAFVLGTKSGFQATPSNLSLIVKNLLTNGWRKDTPAKGLMGGSDKTAAILDKLLAEKEGPVL